MLYHPGFHEQLGSIMDKLAKAAMTEICRLVDDGYTVLRLEISQKQKENEDLKGKLKMLELVLAQEYRETSGTSRVDAINSCSNSDIQDHDKLQGTGSIEMFSFCILLFSLIDICFLAFICKTV